MSELKCPKCGEVFQVDESDYEQIVRQVRDKELTKELERRQKDFDSKLAKELEVFKLQQEKALSEKEQQIKELMGKLESGETEKKLAVSDALKGKDTELAEKEKEIAALQEKLKAGETQKELAVSQALKEKDTELSKKAEEIITLKNELDKKDTESRLSEKSLKEVYEEKLKEKDKMIEQYKDFKARLSTKMVGESLEQHCLAEFNRIRMAGYRNAYFEKDNEVKDGSKGDFIFRDFDENGTEITSIMFEMKNEADETATKHKNEDFLKKLDDDRNKKGCEYAVLVSMLELDNDTYNNGIVDVSYKYPKMYVIRPQFFIPMITLLCNAEKNSLQYKQELRTIRNQNYDVTNFENNVNTIMRSISYNYSQAGKHYIDSIDEIDKTIKSLETIKEHLRLFEKNLRIANDNAQNLSIKKLTKNAPSVKAMFDELEQNK